MPTLERLRPGRSRGFTLIELLVVVAIIGPMWWLGVLFFTGGTPYDRWVDARVSRSRPGVSS